MSQQTLRTFSVLTRWIIGGIFCLYFALIPAVSEVSASSTIPHFFNYQGRLLNPAGQNVGDGIYSIKFSLYAQASGGTPVWTALGTVGSPASLNITVTNGLFSVLLGDTSFQSQNALSGIDWNQDGLYLGISIDTDPEMTPRKRLSSVPFALNSEQLQGQYASSSVASTGGNLFAVHQTTADAASAQRTALSIKTEGTSDANDFLIVGRNSSSDVFTVSRQGSVTTTGNLASNGNVTLGDASSDRVVFNAYVLSDVLPATDLAYKLGDSSHRWLGLDVGTVTTTNLYATTVSSTNGLFANATTTNLYATTVSTTALFVNGQALSSGVPATTATLQTISANGATTTNLIYAFGGLNASNLTATGTTSLQGTTMANATATAVTSTNLYSTFGTIATLGSTYLTATQATATTLAFTNASGSSLLVAGQSVCLANGVNCVNGTLSTLQAVTTNGNVTTLAIGVAGVSSTGDILPTTSALFSLGSGTKSWQNVYASGAAYAHDGIVIGTTSTGQVGAIRYTGTDFEGYDGSWKTLTQAAYANSAPTGFPDTTSTLIAFTTSTRTFAIGPRNGSSYFFYNQGTRYDKSATDTVTITDTEGVWFFYYNGSTLTSSQSPWDLKTVAPVAYVYWDATNKAAIVLGDERHGMMMDARTHEYLHNTVGTRYASGLSLTGTTGGDGSSDSHAEVAVTNGTIYDEDLRFNITNAAAPTNPFEQILTPTATLPVYYRSGTTAWRKQTATQFPVYYTAAGPAYNLLSGTWSTSTVTTTNYVAMWIFGTDNINQPVIAVMGQRVDSSLSNAQANNTFQGLALGTLPFTEMKVLFRLIFLATGTNTPKASLQEIQDLRGVSNLPSGSYVASAHGALTGLLNDDHPQYALLAGRVGGQSLSGGTASGDDLVLDSTANVTKGYISLQPSGGNVGIGVTSPSIFTLQIAGSVGPSSTNAYDLGSATSSWRSIYASGTSQFAYVSSTGITVGGQAVCLANGTNCQSFTVPIGAYIWTDNTANGTIYNTTSSRDVLIGGNTTDTANFIMDKGSGVSSTVIIGSYTGNANLLVGTTTYGGGLDPSFVLNGNDVFGQGMIGSKEGLFSATGVTVGTGSTIYGDGNLYKTTAGDFTLALNNTASNWRFRTGTQEAFTVASTGNIGIGVATPLEALDVSGTIRNVYHEGQYFDVISTSTLDSSAASLGIFVTGRYVYSSNYVGNTVNIIDVSNPALPTIVGTSTLNADANPDGIYVAGRYAYTANFNNSTINIIDVSNPSLPVVVGTSTLVSGAQPRNVVVSGRYAYTANFGNKSINVIDVSNPYSPVVVGTSTLDSGSSIYSIAVSGRYAYTPNIGNGTMNVIDISDPTLPVVVGTTTQPLGGPRGIAVSGRYAYTANYGNSTVNVIDVSNPTLPVVVGTSTLSAGVQPRGIFVSGRYVYTANYTGDTVNIIDVSNPTLPVVVGTSTLSAGALPTRIFIAGRYAYVANSGNHSINILNLKGTETSALLAHSAEVGSLSVLTNANIYNQLTVGGGLVVGSGGLFSQGSIGISSTNTTSTFTFAVSSSYAEISNRLTVGGVNVCLVNGANCPVGTSIWTENPTNNTIYQTNTNRDVLLGGSTTDTAGFIFDKGSTTSSVIIGSYNGNANLLVGTTTYGGGLNANYTLNGNDILAQGMIGSIEGLFSATGVTVGTGSTIYGDGNLYKTTAGDFTLALNNTASSWRFRSGGRETFTVASTGNVGIGATTPLEALDVSGTIRNVLQPGQSYTVAGTANMTGWPTGIAVAGRYAYTANYNNDTVNVIDISNPALPAVVGTSTLSFGSAPWGIAVSGRYAYTANYVGGTVNVIDISNPALPAVVGTSTLSAGAAPYSIAVSGRYAYTTNYNNSTINVIDVSNPTLPVVVGTSTLNWASGVWTIAVSGRYAYTANYGNSTVNVIDISNPTLPVVVGTSTLSAGASPYSVAVSGRYAYTANYGNSTVNVIDVSSPASPVVVATSTLNAGAGPWTIAVAGRYAFTGNITNLTSNIIDISVPTSPVVVGTSTIGVSPYSIAVSGRYAYTANATYHNVKIFDIKGIETSGLIAASAELGNLQVLTNGVIQNNLTVGGGLAVGLGGILSAGSLAVSATNTTSTFLYAVSSSYAMINNLLTVDGRLLVNGDGTGPALDVKGNIQNILSVGQTFSFMSTTPTDAEPYNFDVVGRYAYVCNKFGSSLQIFDVSNVANPSLVSRMTFSQISACIVSGRYIYARTSDGNLGIIDVSNPSSPVQVSTTTIQNNSESLAINGQYLYITDSNGDRGLSIFDISNPVTPKLVGTLVVPGDSAYAVKVIGKYAYLTFTNSNNFRVVDVSNPANPTIVGSQVLGQTPIGLDVQGRYAYVGNFTEGSISIVDIANAAAPRVVATSTGYTFPAFLKVSGRYMYVPNYGSNTTTILDISVPTSPTVINSIVTGASSTQAVISGKYLYVIAAGTSNTLSIIDVKGLETNGLMAASAEVGSLQVLTNAVVSQDFTVNGSLNVGAGGILSNGPLGVQATSTMRSILPSANNAYDLGSSSYAWRNAYSSGTIYGVNMSVASSVSVLPSQGATFNVVTSSFIGTDRYPFDIQVVGKYAYLANSGKSPGYANRGLTVMDVSNPAYPTVVTSVTSGYGLQDIVAQGQYLYGVNSTSDTVTIIDISSPANPRTVFNQAINYDVRDIAASGRYIYAAASTSTNNYILVADVSNPASPIMVTSTFVTKNIYSITIQGKYAYTADDGSNTMSIFDISNPTAPFLTSSTYLGASTYPTDVVVSGRYAYVGNQDDTVKVVDVSNPYSPTIVGSVGLPGGPQIEKLFVSGRYVYTADSLNTNSVTVIDVASSTNPTVVSQIYLGSLQAEPISVFVSGNYLYAASDLNSMLYVVQLKGVETQALAAHSAEIGSLQVLTDATIYNNLNVGGGMSIGPGGIMTMGSLGVASTNTTSTFAYAVSSTYGEFSSRLTVGGVSVCLTNGSNCPSQPASVFAWTDDATNNILYNTTSSRDILMGGSTTATAGFIFDKGAGATSTVIVGSYTGNANLFVGTTTYGGGLSSAFVTNGNDIFAQGMIGSKEGLFSATGVTVGTGSTIYGDGSIYKTTAGDFNLSFGVASTSWRFFAGGSERLTVASTGNIGIGVATPLSALDINGSIDDTPHIGTTFTKISSLVLSSTASIGDVKVVGKYAYSVATTSNAFYVTDVSDVNNPKLISTLVLGSTPVALEVKGRYAYVAEYAGGRFLVIDISNPASPAIVGALTYGNPNTVAVSGNYAYVGDSLNNSSYVVDITNPTAPALAYTSTTVEGCRMAVQGRYLYIAECANITLKIWDITNPRNPVIVGSGIGLGDDPVDLAVSGRYVYIADIAGAFHIEDVSNPSSIVEKAYVSTGGTTLSSLAVSGRYVYITDRSINTVKVFDVSSSTSPVIIGSASTTNNPMAIDVAGRYAYTGDSVTKALSIIDVGGTEMNGLIAASAEVGSLQVLTNGSVFNNFNVGGGLNVGQGGIYTNGTLGVYATSTLNDSIIAGSLAIGTTSTNIAERLQVEGNVLIRKRALAMAEAWNATGTSYTNAPTARYYHGMVWTGSKMIIWGGTSDGTTGLNTGGIYDPISDTWKTITTTNAPYGRWNLNWSEPIWTGSKMIVWGGRGSTGVTSTGGIYDPLTDSWKSVTTTNAPTGRENHVVVWTGSKMIVWGGGISGGGIYDPVTDSWTTMSTTNAPGSQGYSAAVWTTPNGTSSKMFIFTGSGSPSGLFDPISNSWTTVSTTNSPYVTRFHHTAVWTGDKVIVYGGYSNGATTTGGIFDPATNSWSSMTNSSVARYGHSAIWTGSKMIAWGGAGPLNSGEIYDPIANSWTNMTTTNAPGGRYWSGAVWTGSDMIVWGGYPTTVLNSGGIYSPAQYQGNVTAEGDMYIGGQAQVVGDVHAGGYYSRSGSDFAEYMPIDTAKEAPSAGDVVVLSEGMGNRITKSSSATRRYLAGAITNRPAVVGNANEAFKDNPGYGLVSMLGQVDVKFSPANGSIVPGDYLTAGDDGYAVKAKGPGQVLGQALQSGDATSSVLTYINPHWWAGDLLSSSGDANFLDSGLTVSSQGLATSSTPAFGSNLFSFGGSAWDEGSQSAVPTSFSMRNDTVSPTSSFFTLSFATGTNARTSVLSISNLGNVDVSGDLTVGRRLYLGSKTNGTGSTSTYIYVDDTLAPSSTYIATNADGWQTSSTYDYAERYESSDKLNPGDLVTSDNTGVNKVKRAISSLEPILGIVSTKPGFITGGYLKDSYPIALAGRVPTRVSTQNGVIRAGDYLTVSDGNPGLAVKALQSGNIVGIALEPFDQPGEGLISVFVKPGYQNILATEAQAPASNTQVQPSGSGTGSGTGSVRSGLAKIYAGMREVRVSFPTINAYPIINVRPYGQVLKHFWVIDATDHSFTIVVGEAPQTDVVFSWTVLPSQTGNAIYFSDDTSIPYDPTNGLPIGPTPPPAITSDTSTVGQ